MDNCRPGLEVLTSADTVSQLAGVMETSSVLRMRVLDTLVMVAQLSQEHLQVTSTSKHKDACNILSTMSEL